MELASINMHSCLVKSPLSTSSLRWNLTRCPGSITWAPWRPRLPFARGKAGAEGARGGLRLSAEPSGRRAAVRPAPRLERRVVWFLKRPLLPRRAALRPRVPADGTPHPLLLDWWGGGWGGEKFWGVLISASGVVEVVRFCVPKAPNPNAQEPENDV